MCLSIWKTRGVEEGIAAWGFAVVVIAREEVEVVSLGGVDEEVDAKSVIWEVGRGLGRADVKRGEFGEISPLGLDGVELKGLIDIAAVYELEVF